MSAGESEGYEPLDYVHQAAEAIRLPQSVLFDDATRQQTINYFAAIATETGVSNDDLVNDIIAITADIQFKMNEIKERQIASAAENKQRSDQEEYNMLMASNVQETQDILNSEGTFIAIKTLLERLGPNTQKQKSQLLQCIVATLQKAVFEHQDWRDKDPSLKYNFDNFACALINQIASAAENMASSAQKVISLTALPLSAGTAMVISSMYMGTPSLVTALSLGYFGYQGGEILAREGKLSQNWAQDGMRQCIGATATILNGTCSLATDALVRSANTLKSSVTMVAQAGGNVTYGLRDTMSSALSIYEIINGFECSPESTPQSSLQSSLGSPRFSSSSSGSSAASSISAIILANNLVPAETPAANILDEVLDQGPVFTATGSLLESQMSDDDGNSKRQKISGTRLGRVGENVFMGPHRKGGRKSRRHRKRRSTLKRRRIKRRRTRKGKKRRHTKKR